MKPSTGPAMLVIIALLLATSSCLAETYNVEDTTHLPTAMSNDSITIQTTQPRYNNDEDWILIVSNGTSTDIRLPTSQDAEVGERTFRFYRKTTTGWKRLYPIPGYLAEPIAREPGLLIPAGGEVTFSISHIMRSYMEYGVESRRLKGEFIVQSRYEYSPSTSSGELVQYSNSFLIGEAEPVNEIEIVTVSVQPQSLVFDLHNNSNFPFWFPSPCSSAHIQFGGSAFSDDGYLSLQRLADEGAWHIIRVAKTDCEELTELLQIDSGQAVTIDATHWFQEEVNDVGFGVYRWDVVFYLEEYDAGANTRGLRNVRHILSEPFEHGQ